MILPNELLMSRSAEAAVCGSMVFDSKVIPAVLEWIDPSSFAFQENRAIFEAILKVWRHNPGGEVDGVLLRNELEHGGKLKEVGGLDYLREVVETVPTSANAIYYAKEVAERQRYRAACKAVEDMHKVLDEGGPVDEVVQDIQGLAMGGGPEERREIAAKNITTCLVTYWTKNREPGFQPLPAVHKEGVCVTPEAHKCLPEQALTANRMQWRRGDSNPRPEMLQDKRPTCLVAALWISPCEAPRDRLITRLFRCISLPSARTTDESQPTD